MASLAGTATVTGDPGLMVVPQEMRIENGYWISCLHVGFSTGTPYLRNKPIDNGHEEVRKG
ncbi:hypothetical protein ANCDUO_06404 [Ancylostoma duodenale]|uniref:Uncharacterized protein n=1 Tax=Ancylostoma duodenale TaxID=51022 RepID=A0A0C2GW72_9BILA|nr:hypothetical protein ANCDUO_06404 [Ancylostoma duodenale]